MKISLPIFHNPNHGVFLPVVGFSLLEEMDHVVAFRAMADIRQSVLFTVANRKMCVTREKSETDNLEDGADKRVGLKSGREGTEPSGAPRV